jgi:hypothetical protein
MIWLDSEEYQEASRRAGHSFTIARSAEHVR